MKMPRMTTQKIRPPVGIKYFCSEILIFNALYLTVLFIFPFGFSTITTEYSIFFVLFGLAIVCAGFGIHDERDLLIYPHLCVSFFISLIAFAVSMFQLTTVYFCAFIPKQTIETTDDVPQPLDHFIKYYDCSFVSSNSPRWNSIQSSILTIFVFLILTVEKLAECYFFRKLQKCFRRHVTIPVDTPFPTPPPSTIMTNDESENENEEMVIYDKNGETQQIREHAVHQTENPFEKDSSNYSGNRTIS